MKKILFGALLILIGSGCTTGGSKFVEIDGGVIRMDTAAHTGIATQGATYTDFRRCNVDHNNCTKLIGRHIGANPTLLEQLAGPAAMVGSAYLIGDGLKESGDNVNNTNQQQQQQRQRQMSSGMRGWVGD